MKYTKFRSISEYIQAIASIYCNPEKSYFPSLVSYLIESVNDTIVEKFLTERNNTFKDRFLSRIIFEAVESISLVDRELTTDGMVINDCPIPSITVSTSGRIDYK